MTAKLHEVLAVESSLEKVSKKLTGESIKTFGKENLFKGFTKELKMFSDDDQKLNETSHLELETTVGENLEYLIPNIAKYWNSVLLKDATNQVAKADIVLSDGTVLAKDIPATFLLGLETKLGELRKLYDAIPTLAPGIKWVPDELERKGIYTDENKSVSFKQETAQEFVEASPATKEHPAQVVGVKNIKNVGKYTTSSQSGMLSSLEKACKMSRFDELFVAIKKARMRANSVDVVTTERVAEKLFKYING
ncbi:MAG: hypothetical protein KAJ39_01310 [Gammaproteobacteria bacterium]|nr:hypothetical protein [Gammaproteobacteria bacterium]